MGNLHNKTQIPITDAKYSTEKNDEKTITKTGSIYGITSERTSVRPSDRSFRVVCDGGDVWWLLLLLLASNFAIPADT